MAKRLYGHDVGWENKYKECKYYIQYISLIVDWGFLNVMMEHFNFSPVWRRWVMECITTASASVLVNGSPSGEFKLERGLRQGDPLSPFLFLIVAEGLSILMNKAAELELFRGAIIRRNNIHVSHLQFADDTLLMGEESVENARTMKRILRNMELISGLKVNFEKCCVYGVNVPLDRLENMANILGCNMGALPFSYLGIKVGGNHRSH